MKAKGKRQKAKGKSCAPLACTFDLTALSADTDSRCSFTPPFALLPFAFCLLPFAFDRPRRRGSLSLQLLVVLVPVFFGLMGFALDLGRLYLIRGELNQAASSMALTAAGKLIGTA